MYTRARPLAANAPLSWPDYKGIEHARGFKDSERERERQLLTPTYNNSYWPTHTSHLTPACPSGFFPGEHPKHRPKYTLERQLHDGENQYEFGSLLVYVTQ